MVPDVAPPEIAPGLWSWSRRHPEWHPGDFGSEVVAFAARAGDETLLVDPLMVGDDDPAWELIDSIAGPRLRVLITVQYHVRSAEAIRDRYAGRCAVSIHGHPSVADRLASSSGFAPFEAGDPLPAGVTAHQIGKPRRYETPLHISTHKALVFGDAIAGTEDGPRIWVGEKLTDKRRRFYVERFVPTLEPLLELDFDHLLLTHGPSVLESGKDGLREAMREPPWYYRG